MPNSRAKIFVLLGVLHVDLQEGGAGRGAISLRMTWRSTEVLPVVAGPAQMTSFMPDPPVRRPVEALAEAQLSRRRGQRVVEPADLGASRRSSSSVCRTFAMPSVLHDDADIGEQRDARDRG